MRETAVERLAVLPAGPGLAGVEDDLFGRSGWYLALRRSLTPLTDYGVVLVDTPPGLGVLSFLGLQACTQALVVCPPEFLAYHALGQILATVERARQLTPELRVLGILPTLVTGRSRHERTILAEMQAEHGALVLPAVPRRAVLRDAARAGLPVTAYAPRSDAAAAFVELAQVLLDRLMPAAGARA